MLAIFSGAFHLSTSKHFIHINHQLEQLRGWNWEEGSNNRLICTKVTERDSESPIPPTNQTTQLVESRKEITESPVSFPAFPPSFSGTHMKVVPKMVGAATQPLQPQRDVPTQPVQGLLQCTVLCSCPHKGTINLVTSWFETFHFTCKAGPSPGLFGNMYQKMEKKLESEP